MKQYKLKDDKYKKAVLAVLDKEDIGIPILFKEDSFYHKKIIEAGVMHWFTEASDKEVKDYINLGVQFLINS